MSGFDLLQPRREALQAQYDLLSEKLRELRRGVAIEAGVGVRFQLEQEVKLTEAELDKIEQQLVDLERLSGDSRLYQALLKLGYRKQVQTFRRFVQDFPVAAFLIYGGMEYGQRWLLNRLVVQHTQDSIAGKVVKVNLTRVGRRCDVAALWRELGSRVGVGRQGTIPEIVERVHQWWQTQHVLLIFYEVDFLPESCLAELVAEFWEPLVALDQGKVVSPYRLLMFWVDYDGCVGEWGIPFAEQVGAGWSSRIPVKLAKIAEFSESELGGWLEVFSGDLPLGFGEEPEAAIEAILANSDRGIPEPAMGEICRLAGTDWYENEDRWLKL